jgi:hypothetical protein
LALRYQLGNALHRQELLSRLYDARRILQYYSIGTNTQYSVAESTYSRAKT